MARVRQSEAATYVYKITATMPDGSKQTTSRMSRRAARNVAQSFVDGREAEHDVIGDLVVAERPPAMFVEILVGIVDWADEAAPFPGEF